MKDIVEGILGLGVMLIAIAVSCVMSALPFVIGIAILAWLF